MIGKRTLDRGLTIAAAALAPILSILTRHQVITAADAVDLGAMGTAIVAAYHGGALAQRKLADGRSTRPDPAGVVNSPDEAASAGVR